MSREKSDPSVNNAVSIDRRTFAVGAAASAVAVTTSATLARAQDATPPTDMLDMGTPAVDAPAPGVQLEILASGLLDPRFVAVDGDTIYFTEAGAGGDLEVFEMAGEGTPAPMVPISVRGMTGKLSSVSPDGTVTTIVDDFMSYTFGENAEIVGAGGVAVEGGMAYVAVGSPGPFTPAIDLTGEEGVLVEVDLASGEQRIVANLAEYEIVNNPDPMMVDSNIYGVAVREGVAYVTDAGGNSILAVDIASGEITLFAVTGGVDGPFPNPNRQGEMQLDSVPTGIKLGPDDRLYVGYLTGGPFIPGTAKIDAFSADGTVETVATGLTTVTDVAFGPDGHLYAMVMSSSFLEMGPGQVVRVMADGGHMVVVDGLVFPNGMAFDSAGNLIITHKVSFGIPGGGELVRISGVTEEEGTPFVAPEFVMPEGGPPEGEGEGEAMPEGTPAG
jgi:sugar lactone lactonase YvrE